MNYQDWIAENVPDPRRRCAEMTLRMVEAFPELRRVRGHYTCPFEGRHTHWWCVTADGQIVDPTAAQFASRGNGDYEEYDGPEPKGKCLNCGALTFIDSTFCSEECARETTAQFNLELFAGRSGL